MRLTKPHYSVSPNYGHWAFRSLRYLFPLNEYQGGFAFNDAYPNTLGTVTLVDRGTLGSTAAWAPGRGLRLPDDTGSYIDVGADNGLNTEMSFRCRFCMNAVSETLYTLFGANTVGGSEKRLGSLYVETSASTGSVPKLVYWRNSTVRTVICSTQIAAGRWYDVTLTVAGTAGSWTCTVYLNGAQDGQATGVTQNADTTGTPGNVRIGIAGAFLTAAMDGWIDHAMFAIRPWTLAEVISLSRNPWQMYGPRSDDFAATGTAERRFFLIHP